MMKLQFYNDNGNGNGKTALVKVQSFSIFEYIMFIHMQFLY